ncbi:hypothetical protein KBC03_00610 [Patescibacteria group bacterium]|nr:hypothetical protein [Patescibacteria group bacterium]
MTPITQSGSVPYPVSYKYKSAMIKLIPAAPGTGLKAGSALRSVAELAGYTNILSKIMGTNNKLNNALATIMALSSYKVDRSKLPTHDTQQMMQTRKEEKIQEDQAKRAPRRPNGGGDRKPSAGAGRGNNSARGGSQGGGHRPAPKK